MPAKVDRKVVVKERHIEKVFPSDVNRSKGFLRPCRGRERTKAGEQQLLQKTELDMKTRKVTSNTKPTDRSLIECYNCGKNCFVRNSPKNKLAGGGSSPSSSNITTQFKVMVVGERTDAAENAP